MASSGVRGVAVALVALLALAVGTATVTAQGEGITITGQVVNGTADGDVPAGTEVNLRVGQGMELLWENTVQADDTGRFQFTGVPDHPELAYAFDVTYQGSLYRLIESEGIPQGPVEIAVYDATNSSENIRVSETVLLVPRLAEDAEEAVVLGAITLENLGDTTLVPDLSSEMGMDFLRFSLPAGFKDLDVTSDLLSGQIIEVGSGYALVASVPPGQHQVLHSYRLPYADGRLTLDHSFPFGSQTFQLLVNEEIGQAVAPDLVSVGTTSISDTTYLAYEASNIGPGARLSMRLEGLAGRSFLSRLSSFGSSSNLLIVVPAVLGGALLLLLGFAIVWRRRRQAALADAEGSLPQDRPALLDAIARLDESYEQGDLLEDEYHERREALKLRLRQVTLEERQAGVPNPSESPHA